MFAVGPSLWGGADPGLLDSYLTSLRAGYSLKKLAAAYEGPCVRVRRSSDNTEQDIGFAAGVMDSAALLAFAGAGSAFVTKWYDQAGTSFDFAQATSANQPRIVNAGVVDAGVTFIGTNSVSSNRMKTANLGTAEAAFTVFFKATTLGANFDTLFTYNDFGNTSNNNDIYVRAISSTAMRSGMRGDGSANVTADIPFLPTGQVICIKYDRAAATTLTKQRTYQSGSEVTMTNQNNNGTVSGVFPSVPWYLGSRHNNAYPLNGRYETFVIYKAALSDADISAISALLV